MPPGKTKTGCAHFWKTRTGLENGLLLPGWFNWGFRYRGLGVRLGDKAVGQLPRVAIFLPYIHDKKLAALSLAFVEGVLTALKLNHHSISQVHDKKLPA